MTYYANAEYSERYERDLSSPIWESGLRKPHDLVDQLSATTGIDELPDLEIWIET